jgi:hypothetical protein
LARLFILCIALILVLSCAACARRPSQPPPPQPNSSIVEPTSAPAMRGGYEFASNEGTYLLVITPRPNEMPVNEMFVLQVVVFDSLEHKAIVGDIQLAADAAMPAHRHGMNTSPKVIANADGSFTIKGMLLHMSGDWELYFDVTRNGTTERAQLAVTLE